jgi:replication factor C subunit 1
LIDLSSDSAITGFRKVPRSYSKSAKKNSKPSEEDLDTLPTTRKSSEPEDNTTPAKKLKRAPLKASSPKKAKDVGAKEAEPMSSEEKPANIIPSSPQKKKFNYGDYLRRKQTGPMAPGSKEIPVGEENCLEGLTFVFTGELSSISREDSSDLVKRYGGRVTTGPSHKTSYLVVGEDAGESKLAKVREWGIPIINEDQFFDLIRN